MKISKKNKILITEYNQYYSSEAIKIYKNIGDVFYYGLDKFDSNEITTLVVSLAINLNKDFLTSFSSLKYIVSPTTGLNHIDLDYCNKKSIKVISLKDELDFLETIDATPDFTLTMVLSLARKLTESYLDYISSEKCYRNDFLSKEFSNIKVGIAGCGRVGVKLENKLKYLGFRTCGYDPFKNKDYFKKKKIVKIEDISDFLSDIDILVIAISYSKENINFFDFKKLKKLKKGSIVINTARGEVLDENALIDLLESNHISSAGLDVLSIENTDNNKLKLRINKYCNNNNNLLITPHIAGATYGSMRRTQEFVAKKLKSFI